MRIAFRSRGFGLTQALRAHTQRSLLYAVGRFSDVIDDVVVRFSDLNGPRGGVDKICRLDARLVRGATQRAEDVDRDLYAAIDRAAERLGRAVARAVARERSAGAERTREWAFEPQSASGQRLEGVMPTTVSAEEHAETGMLPLETAPAQPSHDDIALRAYEIYLARGAEGGDPLEDWLQAEEELQDRS